MNQLSFKTVQHKNDCLNFVKDIHVVPQGVRQHCYKKKAARVGQNGRLSALCNFSVFDLKNYEAPHMKSQTMRHPLMNLVNTTLSQKYGDP